MFSLKAMSVVSLFIPIVIGYIFYAWSAIENNHMSFEEIKAEKNAY